MPPFKGSPLGELPRLRQVRTRCASNWDRTGGNNDFVRIQSGQSVVLADIVGAGCINHIWCTHICAQPHYLRRLVLRMRWDDEADWSEAPLGDFFGVGHAQAVNFSALPLQMSPATAPELKTTSTPPTPPPLSSTRPITASRCRAGRIGGQDLALPLPHRRPNPLPAVAAGDDRARPRQPPLRRLFSAAYWYQREPHAPFPALPSVGARLPRDD